MCKKFVWSVFFLLAIGMQGFAQQGQVAVG